MIEICHKDNCTGCQTCKMICPQSAIQMSPDKEQGFLYPIIDSNLCIDCNKCVKYCPSNKSIAITKYQKEIYAGWINRRDIRIKSTSGGLFYAFAEQILSKNGVVFGAYWDNERKDAKHSFCERVEELKKFQGSKYIQGDVNKSYKQAKEFLDSDRLVLFSGTPCQVAGLLSFLDRQYDNLHTIDLVCHGVPSPKVLHKDIEEVEKEQCSKLVNIEFRHKTPDQLFTSMKYEFTNGSSKVQSVYKSYYFRGFVNNYFLRKSCYNCKYANINRLGDITLADFWGYCPSKLKFSNFQKGVSMILINNEKGNILFNSVRNNLVFEKSDLELAIKGNRNLTMPQAMPQDYNNFWKDFNSKYSMEELSNLYFPLLEIPNQSKFTILKLWLRLILPENMVKRGKQLFHFIFK